MDIHFIMTLDLLFTIVEKLVSVDSINLLKEFDKSKIINYLLDIYYDNDNESSKMTENRVKKDEIIS